MPSAEIHVPIAPTPGFFTRLRLLAASVRTNAGAFADAPIVAWVSRDVEPYDLARSEPWSRALGVEWRWLDADTYDRWGMYGTALLRFAAEFTAPYVIMMDADIIVTGDLGQLADLTGAGVGGVLAHVSPAMFEQEWADRASRVEGDTYWTHLFTSLGLEAPELSQVHTAWGLLDNHPGRRRSPLYFNLGMIAGTAGAMHAVGGDIMGELQRVNDVVSSPVRCQLALAAAIYRSGTSAVPLGMRWNMPNELNTALAYPLEIEDIRVLHYMYEDEVHRERDMGSLDSLTRLLRRSGLDDVNEYLRSEVAELHPEHMALESDDDIQISGASALDAPGSARASAPKSVEVHVPIAPRERFFTQLRLLAESLRRDGGGFAEARLVAWVSRDVDPYDLDAAHPWAAALGIEWRWIDEEAYERWGMYGTALLRFAADFDSQYVVMLDADVLVTGDLAELADLTGDGIGGVVAHASPAAFPDEWSDGAGLRRGPDYWRDLFAQAGLGPPRLESVHTGWSIMDRNPQRRLAPHYFNLGLIAGSAEAMRRIGAVIMDELDAVNGIVDTWTRCQLAVTLAIARTGVAAVDLPLRWNMPNDMDFCRRHPDDAADLRVVHYLRDTSVSRDEDFASVEGLAALAARSDLEPINEFLRRSVVRLLPQLAPTSTQAANHG